MSEVVQDSCGCYAIYADGQLLDVERCGACRQADWEDAQAAREDRMREQWAREDDFLRGAGQHPTTEDMRYRGEQLAYESMRRGASFFDMSHTIGRFTNEQLEDMEIAGAVDEASGTVYSDAEGGL